MICDLELEAQAQSIFGLDCDGLSEAQSIFDSWLWCSTSWGDGRSFFSQHPSFTYLHFSSYIKRAQVLEVRTPQIILIFAQK